MLDAEPELRVGGQAVRLLYSRVRRGNLAAVQAHEADSLGYVGHLIWVVCKPGGRVVNDGCPSIDVGEIKSVFVRCDRRGRDVAAGLYLHACAVANGEGWPTSIDHSARRTSEGDSWARKMVERYGGYLPELENGQFHVPPAGVYDW